MSFCWLGWTGHSLVVGIVRQRWCACHLLSLVYVDAAQKGTEGEAFYWIREVIFSSEVHPSTALDRESYLMNLYRDVVVGTWCATKPPPQLVNLQSFSCPSKAHFTAPSSHPLLLLLLLLLLFAMDGGRPVVDEVDGEKKWPIVHDFLLRTCPAIQPSPVT